MVPGTVDNLPTVPGTIYILYLLQFNLIAIIIQGLITKSQ